MSILVSALLILKTLINPNLQDEADLESVGKDNRDVTVEKEFEMLQVPVISCPRGLIDQEIRGRTDQSREVKDMPYPLEYVWVSCKNPSKSSNQNKILNPHDPAFTRIVKQLNL